jgi:hypothetical protein
MLLEGVAQKASRDAEKCSDQSNRISKSGYEYLYPTFRTSIAQYLWGVAWVTGLLRWTVDGGRD